MKTIKERLQDKPRGIDPLAVLEFRYDAGHDEYQLETPDGPDGAMSLCGAGVRALRGTGPRQNPRTLVARVWPDAARGGVLVRPHPELGGRIQIGRASFYLLRALRTGLRYTHRIDITAKPYRITITPR